MSSNKKSDSPDFAAKFAKLEEIVEWFSSDIVDVDESLKKFEEGTKLANELKEYLAKTENKVAKIKAKFDA